MFCFCYVVIVFFFFFFKQKTAYEWRISDWSSDLCSSDLLPIWPGGSSGVTWGIGYDGGHQTQSVIVDDWQTHGQVDRLGGTAGITGRAAQTALPRFRDIPTPFDHASQVFEERSLVEYERRTERAFRRGFVDQIGRA